MTSSHPFLRVRLVLIALTCGLSAVFPPSADAQGQRVEIVGDYRYAFHDPETLADAKAAACRGALRVAIGNSPLVREQTASLVDSPALSELVHLLASSYAKDQEVIEYTEKGRTVSCKIKATLQSDEVQNVIRVHLSGGQDASGLDQNRALKILHVREEKDGTIFVTFQALKRLDWLATAYDGSLRESADLMVDFYDEQGTLIRTDRYPARKTLSGEDIMHPGEIGIRKVTKPLMARSYRVWLVK